MKTINISAVNVNNILVASYNGGPFNVEDTEGAREAIIESLDNSKSGTLAVIEEDDEEFEIAAKDVDWIDDYCLAEIFVLDGNVLTFSMRKISTLQELADYINLYDHQGSDRPNRAIILEAIDINDWEPGIDKGVICMTAKQQVVIDDSNKAVVIDREPTYRVVKKIKGQMFDTTICSGLSLEEAKERIVKEWGWIEEEHEISDCTFDRIWPDCTGLTYDNYTIEIAKEAE